MLRKPWKNSSNPSKFQFRRSVCRSNWCKLCQTQNSTKTGESTSLLCSIWFRTPLSFHMTSKPSGLLTSSFRTLIWTFQESMEFIWPQSLTLGSPLTCRGLGQKVSRLFRSQKSDTTSSTVSGVVLGSGWARLTHWSMGLAVPSTSYVYRMRKCSRRKFNFR